MKFSVTFKDPDGPSTCFDEEARRTLGEIGGLSDGERALLIEERRSRLSDFAGRWLEHGEYVTIEFDTEAETATIIKMP
jgi:hypothetical protein